MYKIFILISLFVTTSLYGFQERKLYVGHDSTEAKMTFDYEVEMKSSTQPTVKEALRHIDKQVLHLFGTMGGSTYQGVPRGNHEISDIQISQLKAKTYRIRYHYKGTIVLQNGPETKYEITLPVNPDTIYRYECTDNHHPQEEYFWYFWDPFQEGCTLEEGKDYEKVEAQIKRYPNTSYSYPEYERLVDDSGTLHITILVGMDDPFQDKNPAHSKDLNASSYRDIREDLLKKFGYKLKNKWSKDQIFSIAVTRPSTLPYVEEFVKDTPKAKIIIRMFFGPTDNEGDYSEAFYYFYKDAMENSSIMIYDGHSGLGKYLDLKQIEETQNIVFNPNKNRYQIYFFNSCSSYSYYNEMFFGRKASETDPKGTKNLDILTNGLATAFYVLHDTNMNLINAIDAWANDKARIRYQSLASQIDSGNLFGINGDEDNE